MSSRILHLLETCQTITTRMLKFESLKSYKTKKSSIWSKHVCVNQSQQLKTLNKKRVMKAAGVVKTSGNEMREIIQIDSFD